MKAHHNSHEEIIRMVIDGEAERAADAMRRRRADGEPARCEFLSEVSRSVTLSLKGRRKKLRRESATS
jgi:DNA-binding GntR family transcriptional regulator